MKHKVYILCGISGSGKSTLAQKISEEHHTTDVLTCSADHYFIDHEGEYNFNPAELPDAHAHCLRKFTRAITGPESGIIIVDNTNTTIAEVAPYAALAIAYGYVLEIIILYSKNVDDVKEIAARNVHGVPYHVVLAQHLRLKSMTKALPSYWNARTLNVS